MSKRIFFSLLILMLCYQTLSQSYEEILKDSTKCYANENINTCTNVKLSLDNLQCCKVSTTTYTSYYYSYDNPYTISICSIQVAPIKIVQEELEKETTKALYKETWGYVTNSFAYGASNSKVEMVYSCEDGTATMRFGFDTYTNEEIEILQSDNHCLSYFYGINEFTSKEDCFNSVLLPSSKNVGLSCGYFEFNIKYTDGTSENIKSCSIFNKDVITSSHLDDKSKENFETFVQTNKDDDKTVLSYVVALSDDQGNSAVYDSLTQSINPENSEKKITLVKYLLFISLLLIL